MNSNQQGYKPLIDWLNYRSYEHNRVRNPTIPYHKWRALYSNAVMFEEIFELNSKQIQKKGEQDYDSNDQ